MRTIYRYHGNENALRKATETRIARNVTPDMEENSW